MADEGEQTGRDLRADELAVRPAESLNVEVKTWLDPTDDFHAVKLVRALFAIRNRNGGFLVIGFDDKTLQPDAYQLSRPLEDVYHHDEIQGLVSRYAHESFEIEVRMGERDGNRYPIIAVPEGVRTPVVVKRDLIDKTTQKPLLVKGEIFFRTLQSNGTPSSARIAPGDLSDLMEICFDNREVDIGRFLRRQLGGSGAEMLRTLLGAEPAPSAADQLKARADALIVLGDAAFDAAYAASPVPQQKPLYLDGLTIRVGMVADPLRGDALPTSDFMNRLNSANPQYSGWPAWFDARPIHRDENRAKVEGGAWVAYIRGGDRGERERLEYQLYDPRGDFYIRRLMQDDTSDKIKPFALLDPILMMYRVTEFIAAGISVLRGAGWSEEDRAGFAFSWSGLDGRRINSWSNQLRFYGAGEGYESRTAGTSSYVEIGLDTPHIALAPAVERATAPLFACFQGYQPPPSLVEEAVRTVVERRL